MTITKLIKVLEEAKEKYGNIQVRIQNRDGHGCIGGLDDYIYAQYSDPIEDGEANVFIL